MNKICFREEAKDWNEALPIGNGFLGAMVFGKTGTERLQINEDSVWTGSFMERVNPDARENYPKVRELLLNGEIEQAELPLLYILLSMPEANVLFRYTDASSLWQL